MLLRILFLALFVVFVSACVEVLTVPVNISTSEHDTSDASIPEVAELVDESTIEDNNPTSSQEISLPEVSSRESPETPAEHIMFLVKQNENYEIYVMSLDTSEQINLTDNPARDVPMGWSPDGTKILFVSDRDGNHEIYGMNADGSGLTNLTNHPSADVGGAWSPDGMYIAFASDRDGASDIYIMKADGSELRNVTNSKGEKIGSFHWSPNGQGLVVNIKEAEDKARFEIFVVSIDTGERTQLTDDPGTILIHESSPDGHYLAYAAIDMNDFSKGNYVKILSTDGTVEELEGGLVVPSWSPNGEHMVFAGQLRGKSGIYLADSKGYNPVLLVENRERIGQYSWSPDSTHIVFMLETDEIQDLYMVDINGGKPIRLTNSPTEQSYPYWQP